jgi:hypothetical protein
LWRVPEYEPNWKTTHEFISPELVKGTIANFSLETIDGRTRLTETIDLKLGGFYRLAGPFLALRGGKPLKPDSAK